MNSTAINKVLKKHTPVWMKIPGVIGTGIGKCDDELCIKVFVKKLTDEIKSSIPPAVDGYKVQVVVTGTIKAQ